MGGQKHFFGFCKKSYFSFSKINFEAFLGVFKKLSGDVLAPSDPSLDPLWLCAWP